jgi:acid phosphatase
MTPLKSLFLASLLLAFAACTTTPAERPLTDADLAALRASPSPRVVPDAPAKGAAAHDNLNAIAWMQASQEYRLLVEQTFRAATAQLEPALRTPGWDALAASDRANPATGLPPAVIVDIDETMLDNSPYQARLTRDGGEFSDPTWDAWVREEKATALPGALAFAQAAAARGITIFYVSNRAVHLDEPTLANLRATGFPIPSPDQFLGLGHVVDGCEQHGSEKTCRRQQVGRTHRVLLQIGDQIGDMVTVLDNSASGRDQAIAPYRDWFGERWFVLPNPSYGSWEPVLFDNDWSLPDTDRRQRKLGRLRYD